MKNPLRLLWGPLLMISAMSGLPAQSPYFQQEVHYRIEVSLDDVLHLLRGQVEIIYINHSPDVLRSLYFHLWPNAYRDRSTAFARQQWRLGEKDFYFAKPDDLGFIDSLAFTVDEQPAKHTPEPEHPDITRLRLRSPLLPGDTLVIRTPFRVKIPASFSRLGHEGQSYQISQWYPRPAVYDGNGWHPMPYLDIGEFYSEFGSFDVSINLPGNYVVGATGVLLTASEKQFLAERVALTETLLKKGFDDSLDFPPSSPARKTIRYTADRVHDFAWFADKRYHVLKSEVVLPSGRPVDTWAMFTNAEADLWTKATAYINRAVLSYSEWIGEYPYPQATAVQGALGPGGGMEYPMVTVIAEAGEDLDLDLVITHEVGHNWFYGILASNERDHPWMDEGINTYYERRYLEKYYPDREDLLPEELRSGSEMSFTELAYLFLARRHRDQAPDTPADEFSLANYWLGAYEKPGWVLGYLAAWLEQETFDRIMQTYYRQWQFRHPQPADLRRLFEAETGRDLSWFFDGLLASTGKMDYALTGMKAAGDSLQVQIANRGDIAAPFSVSGVRNGEIIATRWYDGFSGRKILPFLVGDYDELAIDAQRLAPELYRQNNYFRPGRTFPRLEPFQFTPLPAIENDRRTRLYGFPIVGWNAYDKTTVGMLLYNTVAPPRRFEFAVAPLFGFASKDLAGWGFARYHWFPAGSFLDRVTLGLEARQFHFDRNATLDYDLKYARLQPFLRLVLGRKPASNFHQALQWRTLWLNTERPAFSGQNDVTRLQWDNTFIHELSYTGEQRRAINPFTLKAALEYQAYEDVFRREASYLRASVEWKGAFHYAPRRRIDYRVFVGGFPFNDRRESGAIFPGAFNLISQGYNDYRFDDFYLGRTEDSGIWSQQISLRDGAMKTAIGTGFSLGRSNSFIAAINLKTDLPGDFLGGNILKPYLDIGYFDNAMPTGRNNSFSDQILWSGGFMIDVLDGTFGVYFPVFNSRNLADRLAERGNYFTRITFNIDFDRLNPFELVDRIRL